MNSIKTKQLDPARRVLAAVTGKAKYFVKMRIIATILGFLLIQISGSSQTIHLTFGATSSKLIFEHLSKYTNTNNERGWGLNALVGVDYINSKFLYMSSNVGLAQINSKDSFEPTGEYYPPGTVFFSNTRMNFLTLNTTLNFKVPIKNIAFPFIRFGPRFDFLLSYKEDEPIFKRMDDLGKIRKFLLGLTIGGGINFKIEKIRIGFLFDYYLYTRKMVDYSVSGDVNAIYYNTYTLNFNIGYIL